MHEDGLDLVPVVVDDDTYRQAYDVVANTTLWYCHHHLWDLPHRPRFDRHWRAAWEGYRAYNRAMADAVAERADDGGAVFVQDYHFSLLGRMLAERRPDLRTVHFLHTPFADAATCSACCPTTWRPSCSTAWPATAPAASTATSGRPAFLGCYAAAGRAAPSTFVAPLGPDAGVLEEEAASPGGRGRGRCAARRGGRTPDVVRSDRMEPSKNIVRGMLAFEELLTAHPEWRGEVVHVALRLPQPAGAGGVSRLRGRRGAHGRAHQPRLRCRASWTPIVLSVDDDRARSLAALSPPTCCWSTRCATGSTWWPRRARCSTRVDGVLVLSREAGAWEELRSAGGALGVNPFDVVATAEALHGRPHHGRRRAGPAGGGRCGRPVRGRTAADWWADQLAAAQRCTGSAAAAASASRRSSATAPAAPGTVRSARRGHRSRALGVDGGDPHGTDGVPGAAAARSTASNAGRSPRSSPNAATWRSRPGGTLGRQRPDHRALVHVRAAGGARAPCGRRAPSSPRRSCWRSANGHHPALVSAHGASAA